MPSPSPLPSHNDDDDDSFHVQTKTKFLKHSFVLEIFRLCMCVCVCVHEVFFIFYLFLSKSPQILNTINCKTLNAMLFFILIVFRMLWITSIENKQTANNTAQSTSIFSTQKCCCFFPSLIFLSLYRASSSCFLHVGCFVFSFFESVPFIFHYEIYLYLYVWCLLCCLRVVVFFVDVGFLVFHHDFCPILHSVFNSHNSDKYCCDVSECVWLFCVSAVAAVFNCLFVLITKFMVIWNWSVCCVQMYAIMICDTE